MLNVDEAVQQVVALGGNTMDDARFGGEVTVADTEGNEFCLSAFRRGKDGKRSPFDPNGDNQIPMTNNVDQVTCTGSYSQRI